MNRMSEVAKLIGVELDKPFRCDDEDVILTNKGLFSHTGICRRPLALTKLLAGELKPEWYPKDGEMAHVLNIDGTIDFESFYKDNTYMARAFKNGMIFRTESEAITRREEFGWVSPEQE